MHRASLMLLLLKIMQLKRDKQIPKLSQSMGGASLEVSYDGSLLFKPH